MTNLEVFWNVDQQFPCQFQADNLSQIPLNVSNSCSDFNILQSDKSNNDLSLIDYKQFLNLGEEQYQSLIQDQLCSDDCQFLNQEQVNLIQNVNRDEKKEYTQDNIGGNLVLVNQEQTYKMLQKQKRKQQREKAKNRKRNAELANSIQVKQEEESTEKSLTAQIKIEEEEQQVFNPKEKKKQLQQIRNRISAQMSRDKKKAYVTTLEENSKKLEEKLKALEEENAQLKKNLHFLPESKRNFILPKKDAFKYGFAFFSLMALVCSIQMQNHSKSLKQVESIEQPVANNSLNSINLLSGFNCNNNLQESNFNESLENQGQLKILPQVKIEEEIVKEEPREEKIEKVSKKISKQRKPGQRKVRGIDSK